jgi:hypothetical protein
MRKNKYGVWEVLQLSYFNTGTGYYQLHNPKWHGKKSDFGELNG